MKKRTQIFKTRGKAVEFMDEIKYSKLGTDAVITVVDNISSEIVTYEVTYTPYDYSTLDTKSLEVISLIQAAHVDIGYARLGNKSKATNDFYMENAQRFLDEAILYLKGGSDSE